MAGKPKVFVTRIIPDAGLNKIKAACDAEVWTDPPPPPADVLRRRVADVTARVAAHGSHRRPLRRRPRPSSATTPSGSTTWT
jgi:hypothetical protein